MTAVVRGLGQRAGDIPPLVWLISLTIVGATLRVVDLGAKSFWIDELISVCHAEHIRDVSSLLTPACGNAHPPGYFVLVKLWSTVAHREWSLRLLSAAFGTALIPLVYVFARDLVGRTAALIASALVAISPFHLLYDRELRMYSLFALLSLVSLHYFLRALRDGRTTDWARFTVLTIGNLYVHYHAFLLLIAEGAIFVVSNRRREAWKAGLVSLAATAGAFGIWIPGFLFQLRHPALFALDAPDKFPVVAGAGLARGSYLVYAFALGQTLMPWRVVAVVGMCAVAVAVIAGVRELIDRPWFLIVAAVVIGVPPAVGFFVSSSMPRYYIFGAPVFLVVVAVGVAVLRPPWARIAVVSAMLVASGVSVANYYGGRDFHILAPVDPWRDVGSYLLSRAHAGDCVVTIGAFRPLAYYTNDLAPFRRPVYSDDFKAAAVCLDDRSARRVWIVTADPAVRALADEAVRWFDSRYVRVAERRFLRDPEHEKKARWFKKAFLEYRISVYGYERS